MTTPHAPVQARSMFVPSMIVTVDPWTENYLLEDALQSVPQTVRLAVLSNGDAPKMFCSGTADLPPFVASGVDPSVLTLLPWKLRHPAAIQPDPTVVLGWIEEYGQDANTIETPSAPGLEDYIGRFRDWLADKWTNPDPAFKAADPKQVAAAQEDVFHVLFGPQVAALDTQIAAVNAAAGRFTEARDWRAANPAPR